MGSIGRFSVMFLAPFRNLCGFQAHLFRGCTPFVEDQALEVVGQVCECEFGLRLMRGSSFLRSCQKSRNLMMNGVDL